MVEGVTVLMPNASEIKQTESQSWSREKFFAGLCKGNRWLKPYKALNSPKCFGKIFLKGKLGYDSMVCDQLTHVSIDMVRQQSSVPGIKVISL